MCALSIFSSLKEILQETLQSNAAMQLHCYVWGNASHLIYRNKKTNKNKILVQNRKARLKLKKTRSLFNNLAYLNVGTYNFMLLATTMILWIWDPSHTTPVAWNGDIVCTRGPGLLSCKQHVGNISWKRWFIWFDDWYAALQESCLREAKQLSFADTKANETYHVDYLMIYF